MTTTERTMVRTLAAIDPAELPSPQRARAIYEQYRQARGWLTLQPLLTAPDGNYKLSKSGKSSSVATYGLSLAPANVSGALNTCPFSTRGCRALCLNTAGKGTLDRVQRARADKTRFLVDHPSAFLALLVDEIRRAVRIERKRGNRVGMRLNVLSDLRWEIATPWLFDLFADVTFYDYTKHPERVTPRNYVLTYSASERMSHADVFDHLDQGRNVTIVADKVRGDAPRFWFGRPVVNGDLSDYRPADPRGVVVWLAPKGAARKAERGGFVRHGYGFAR